MKVQKKLQITAGFETLTLGLLIASIFIMEVERAEYFRLFELLGVNLAVITTTYGIYKMRALS